MWDEPVWKQRNWQPAELESLGFRCYEARPEIRMARVVEDPSEVEITNERLAVEAGYILCYNPGSEARAALADYEHWPVRFDLFHQTYKPWPTENWQPNPAERHLLSLGCRPYYKAVGVWARRLRRSARVQSLESPMPITVPAGRWLCIGAAGEPYHMDNDKFRRRYIVPPESLLARFYWAVRLLNKGAQ
jgi:hypothetical protein